MGESRRMSEWKQTVDCVGGVTPVTGVGLVGVVDCVGGVTGVTPVEAVKAHPVSALLLCARLSLAQGFSYHHHPIYKQTYNSTVLLCTFATSRSTCKPHIQIYTTTSRCVQCSVLCGVVSLQ